MKHLEVRQKILRCACALYFQLSSQCFSLVSSGDETLRLMLDIYFISALFLARNVKNLGKHCCLGMLT